MDRFSSPLVLQPNAGGKASGMYRSWFQQIWFSASGIYNMSIINRVGVISPMPQYPT